MLSVPMRVALSFRHASALLAVLAAPLHAQLVDVTQPGDLIVPTSNMSPESEDVTNAIDNQPTKYLNFDKLNTGFTVTPHVGTTIVQGLTLTSANDHPDFDPASYILSGSNDGSNFIVISSGVVPPFPARFHKQEFLFLDHTNGYTSYRVIFPTVADPAVAVAMHIAEVELLGELPPIGPCNPTNASLIRVQPIDTPVLLGARATFRVEMTGPWQSQWYRDGVEVPGATGGSYITPPATAADDGARFRVRVTGNGCYQDSDEVMLSIFTPSKIESIGLNFLGHGSASGPAEMFSHDITGIHPQAYWTNVTGPFSGNVGSVVHPLTSSNRPHATITVYWDTSSQWGASLGDDTPIKRMFDGMATCHGTNPDTAQSVTFSNVPPGSHSLLVYSVQRPMEFFSMEFHAVTLHPNATTPVSQRRFIRPQNGDEYRASPGFHLVTADTPPALAVGNTLRFDNLQPGDGRIELRFFSPDRVQPPPPAETIRGPGISGVQLLINPFGVQTRLSNIVYSGTSASFSYGTIAGLSYTVEYTDALGAQANWIRLLPMAIGNGSPLTAVDSSPNPRMRFYRVRVE
jgi:hypothetical protein